MSKCLVEYVHFQPYQILQLHTNLFFLFLPSPLRDQETCCCHPEDARHESTRRFKGTFFGKCLFCTWQQTVGKIWFGVFFTDKNRSFALLFEVFDTFTSECVLITYANASINLWKAFWEVSNCLFREIESAPSFYYSTWARNNFICCELILCLCRVWFVTNPFFRSMESSRISSLMESQNLKYSFYPPKHRVLLCICIMASIISYIVAYICQVQQPASKDVNLWSQASAFLRSA